MCQNLFRQTRVIGSRVLKVVATCVLAFLLMSSFQTTDAQANGTITVRVVDPQCRRIGHLIDWSYSSVETAVKDTIPGEWGPPLNPLTYEVLKEAAVKYARGLCGMTPIP